MRSFFQTSNNKQHSSVPYLQAYQVSKVFDAKMKRLRKVLKLLYILITELYVCSCFFTCKPPFIYRYSQSETRRHRLSLLERIAPTRSSEFVLAKTKESFKLSDLYLLETKLEALARNLTEPERIGVDFNTGSYLVQVHRHFITKYNNTSSLDRYDWIATDIIASGSSGQDLVDDIIERCRCNTLSIPNLDDFTLDYICMGYMKEKDFTSKHLISRVSQCIPSFAALNSKTAKHQLVLIETPGRLYLAQREHVVEVKVNTVVKRWPGRTFQYSSAINPSVALIIVDLLYDLTLRGTCRESSRDGQEIKMLDPTCGSGTFLAFALAKGMHVVGYDIKDKCVSGTRQNLVYLFGDDMVSNKSEVLVGDFSSSDDYGKPDSYKYDCAVTNLPWGQNTEIKNKDDNMKILKRVHQQVRQGAYCAIVSKSDVAKDVSAVGFRMIGTACIPQADFTLPSSKKKKKATHKKLDSSNCIVSIVIKDNVDIL